MQLAFKHQVKLCLCVGGEKETLARDLICHFFFILVSPCRFHLVEMSLYSSLAPDFTFVAWVKCLVINALIGFFSNCFETRVDCQAT